MVRKNLYASNIIETLVSNAVGTGIKPQFKVKNAEFSKVVQALWLRWSDEADSHSVHDFYGLQASNYRSIIEGCMFCAWFKTKVREVIGSFLSLEEAINHVFNSCSS